MAQYSCFQAVDGCQVGVVLLLFLYILVPQDETVKDIEEYQGKNGATSSCTPVQRYIPPPRQ
ncbi:MAG: hypothetical protein H6556_30125 [Lewinellaceae bacterium]|nr:hypothetical protein [Lewinellaceae bacterium]